MTSRSDNLFVRFAVLLFALPSTVLASEGWYDTYEQAQQAAQDKGVPLLIHFHASYCGPCLQMESQVFSQPSVQQQLRKGVAAVEVDVSARPDLAAKYAASSIPRDVVVYAGRQPETLGIGFKSAASYRDMLQSIAAKGRAISRTQTSQNRKIPQHVLTEKPAEEQDSKPILGLEGYCPVSLIRDRSWVSGRQSISETYRGVTYYFKDTQSRDEFRANAVRLTPQNLGCDPVLLYTQQRAVTGKIRIGAFFDNQLYLFASEDNRTEFKRNPLRYTRIRHAVKANDLTGQRYF